MNDHPTTDAPALMDLSVETCYVFDARGRMLYGNAPDRLPVPRLAFAWTVTSYHVRFGAAVPDDLAHALAELVRRAQPDGTLTRPPGLLAALRARLGRDAPIQSEGGGPHYHFPDDLTIPSGVVQIAERNLDLVRETFPWIVTAFAGWAPYFAVVRDGAAVAVCFNARRGPRAAEAGVYTLAEYRGQGHATTVTRAWGAATRAAGLVPLYSTSSDNLASQGVARRAGLIQFGASTTWA